MSLGYRKVVLIIILVASLSSVCLAGQHSNDRWFAKDKYQHFAVSAFYSAGTTLVAHRHFEMGQEKSMAIGIGITLSLGAAKEGWDYKSRKGTASIKDFIWDIAGALTGALVIGLTE